MIAIRAQIARAAEGAGRDPASIRLIAVSKTQPRAAIEALIAAGQMDFGENRVQEAAAKFPDLRARHPGLRLNLIGPLQTNKLRDALGVFDSIDSLDRPRLADALAQAADRGVALPRLLIQVNIGDEPQKSGVARAEADGFIRQCQSRFGAALQGLMAIPPAGAEALPFFRELAAMAAHHGLPVVSMGMSGDFTQAIMAGATEVRVGSALFGARA